MGLCRSRLGQGEGSTGLSFRAGLKEADKQNLLEQIQQMAGLNLLMLVLLKGRRSQRCHSDKESPIGSPYRRYFKDSFWSAY